MPLSRTRDYLSIGEVLDAVRPDFPDVSISKIRFLEAEGLITPERTPSGYRKFYDGDVARLRYILSLQRDQFLPLRVIRERLAAIDSNGGRYPQEIAPERAPAGAVSAPTAQAQPPVGVHLSRADLRDAAGLEEAQIGGLEEFGLIEPGRDSYDERDLVIARAAARLFAYGAEPRHLRMYRQVAEREAGFIEQMVAPLSRRAPGDERVARAVRELTEASRALHDAMLRVAADQLL